MRTTSFLSTVAAAAALLLSSFAAEAVTVTFGDYVSSETTGLTPSVTITDITGGVSISVASSGEPGKLTGLAFEVSDRPILITDIIGWRQLIKEGRNGFGYAKFMFRTDTNAIGNVNFNSAAFATLLQPAEGAFDFIFELATPTDVSITPLTFTLWGATTSEFELVGLWLQSVGTNGEGSSKILGQLVDEPEPEPEPEPAPVPLPATGLLLLAGLTGLGAASRLRRPR